jgi:hypothetical protein
MSSSCAAEANANDHDHSHSHDHDHSHSHDHSHDLEHDGAGDSLWGFIDTSRVRCLNESSPGSVLNCLKPWNKRYEVEPFLESNEDDCELLIHIPFTSVVKVRAICLGGGREGSAPSRMKVWVDRDDIDFSNASELPAAQAVELVEPAAGSSDSAVVEYPAKMSKMQNVSSLTIFLPETFGADTTIVTFLGFKGESTNARHAVVEAVYESKPQAADHKTRGNEFTNASVL